MNYLNYRETFVPEKIDKKAFDQILVIAVWLT